MALNPETNIDEAMANDNSFELSAKIQTSLETIRLRRNRRHMSYLNTADEIKQRVNDAAHDIEIYFDAVQNDQYAKSKNMVANLKRQAKAILGYAKLLKDITDDL